MRKLFKNIEIALLMFESWGSLYLAKTLDCFATNSLMLVSDIQGILSAK